MCVFIRCLSSLCVLSKIRSEILFLAHLSIIHTFLLLFSKQKSLYRHHPSRYSFLHIKTGKKTQELGVIDNSNVSNQTKFHNNNNFSSFSVDNKIFKSLPAKQKKSKIKSEKTASTKNSSLSAFFRLFQFYQSIFAARQKTSKIIV